MKPHRVLSERDVKVSLPSIVCVSWLASTQGANAHLVHHDLVFLLLDGVKLSGSRLGSGGGGGGGYRFGSNSGGCGGHRSGSFSGGCGGYRSGRLGRGCGGLRQRFGHGVSRSGRGV